MSIPKLDVTSLNRGDILVLRFEGGITLRVVMDGNGAGVPVPASEQQILNGSQFEHLWCKKIKILGQKQCQNEIICGRVVYQQAEDRVIPILDKPLEKIWIVRLRV